MIYYDDLLNLLSLLNLLKPHWTNQKCTGRQGRLADWHLTSGRRWAESLHHRQPEGVPGQNPWIPTWESPWPHHGMNNEQRVTGIIKE